MKETAEFRPYDYDEPTFLHQIPISEEEDYDSRTVLEIVAVPENLPRKFLKDYMHEHIDTHCHHEYDCCGNWYASALTYKGVREVYTNIYSVVVSYRRNV